MTYFKIAIVIALFVEAGAMSCGTASISRHGQARARGPETDAINSMGRYSPQQVGEADDVTEILFR